jgi:hypothetical protein
MATRSSQLQSQRSSSTNESSISLSLSGFLDFPSANHNSICAFRNS